MKLNKSRKHIKFNLKDGIHYLTPADFNMATIFSSWIAKRPQ